jgi:hypothetical protein
VWIATYQGGWQGWYSGEQLGFGPRQQPSGFGYCSTFLVGRLVLQVLGHDLAEATPLVSSPDADQLSTQIWPVEHALVHWPPEVPIDDELLAPFAGQFSARAA